MNAGKDYHKAIRIATQNARLDGKTRFVWKWGDAYRVERTPPDSAHVGDFDIIVPAKPREKTP